MTTKYLGPVWEMLEKADGTKELTKLHAFWIRGERRFALTEQAARDAVASAA